MLDPMEALATALVADIGIVVRCENPVAYQQKLYAVRRQNPEFAGISIHISRTEPATDLWLIKENPDAPPEAGI